MPCAKAYSLTSLVYASLLPTQPNCLLERWEILLAGASGSEHSRREVRRARLCCALKMPFHNAPPDSPALTAFVLFCFLIYPSSRSFSCLGGGESLRQSQTVAQADLELRATLLP